MKKRKTKELAIAEARLEALKAKMNPHFIGNTLTAIRSMVKSDPEKVRDYIAVFANMVTQTMRNASIDKISLANEIRYISDYLNLQKLRYDEKLKYEIVCDNLPAEDILVPPTLFQPYIENSIEHGIRHRTDGGTVTITFKIEGKLLKAIIDDNGVGRKRAREIEASLFKGRVSSSGRITEDRISLYNKLENTNDYNIEYYDKEDNGGTSVIISLPLMNSLLEMKF